jgi:drug/metabolite transporter (DMT)-like permease
VSSPDTALTRGVLLAIAASVAFGLTTPFVQVAGAGLGAFTTAALLYVGAAGLAAVFGGAGALPRVSFRTLGFVAVCGAFVAPALLAAGLSRASGTAASLLLNLEAVFTVLLGALVHREAVVRRVWLAVAVIAGGGALLVLDRADGGFRLDLGLLLVAAATLFWALDNTLSRALSDFEPARVVTWKGALGALLSTGVAVLVREPLPTPSAALSLLACGAIGYGASLRLYLLAQRALGSARTGSVFAVGPFVGALAAAALGQPLGGWLTVAGGVAIVVGVYLHLTEQHAHPHEHPAETHTHAHRHDDGHHDHAHPGLDPATVHTHEHAHAATAHSHGHGEDIHHRHHG